MKTIGERLGVGESRISQIHKDALARCRATDYFRRRAFHCQFRETSRRTKNRI